MIVTKDLQLDVQGETIFEKVNLVLRSGERVGIMGSSDQNVSLFLKVLAGEIEMDKGRVTTEGERLAYISTDTALNTQPTFIICDLLAQSNSDSLAEVKNLLQSFRGGLLIASHDDAIMSNVKITRMLELHTATKSISSFTAIYTDYLLEREKNETRMTEAYKKQQKEKKRLEDWLEQKRKEASIDRSPQKGSTIRTKAKYLQREILNKEIPRPSHLESDE
jgi:ATPase subunit of ABC transporter with duplicated ATPase domains